MSGASKVLFTVRRPTPMSRDASSGGESDGPSFKIPALPRHLANDSSKPSSPLSRSAESSPKPRSRTFEERDSSDEDEDDGLEEELVTGFDQFGVQRLHERKKPQGPLVIAPLGNRDWREVARVRKSSERFIPGAGKAATGADGSVGGLGTRDSINSGPVLVGLQFKQKRIKLEHEDMDVDGAAREGVKEETEEEETEEQKAIRAVLASASGEATEDGPIIDAIHSGGNTFTARTLSETEALRQDVAELPDAATLDAYERVPVSQFGAAMLRGMGWKEGTAATRKPGKGLVEPWMPEARPALLGIGAKEREVLDDGDPKKKKKGRPDMKYMPLVKKEKERGAGEDGSDGGRLSRNSGGSARDRERDDRDRRDKEDRNGKDRRDRDHDERDRKDRGHDDKDRKSRDYDRDRSERDHGAKDRERRGSDRHHDDRARDGRDKGREDRDVSRSSRRDRSRDRDEDRSSSRRRDKDRRD